MRGSTLTQYRSFMKAKNRKSELREWLKQQAAMADKSSRKWAAVESSHQKAYRSGMWYAYQQTLERL